MVLVLGSPRAFGTARTNRDFTLDNLERTAVWLDANVRDDQTVLVHDAGYVAWRTDLRLRDMVGLKSPDVIEVHRRVTGPSCGGDRWKAIHTVAAASRPDFVVLLETWDERFQLRSGLQRAGWTLEPVYTTPSPSGYVIYEVTGTPGALQESEP